MSTIRGMHELGDFVPVQPGDFILTGVKAQGIVSRAIKLGTKLRRYPDYAQRFSHTALVVSVNGDLIEAQAKGVKRTHLSRFKDDDYVIVRTNCNQQDMNQILKFADSVVNAKTSYGFWTFAGLALYCLTGGQLCVQKAGTAICSGLVADALTRAGFIFERPPYANMPADLAVKFDVH